MYFVTVHIWWFVFLTSTSVELLHVGSAKALFRVSGCLFVACLQLKTFVFDERNFNSCPDDPQALKHTQNQQDHQRSSMFYSWWLHSVLQSPFPSILRNRFTPSRCLFIVIYKLGRYNFVKLLRSYVRLISCLRDLEIDVNMKHIWIFSCWKIICLCTFKSNK